MRAGQRRGVLASAGQSSGGAGDPVSYLADFPQITATNNYHTVITATGELDLTAFDGAENTALVVGFNWYANGGGPVTYLCTYDETELTLMVGEDRSLGSNYGAMLWIIQNPPSTGQLLCRTTGTANTGRNLWAAATLFSGVDSWSPGSWAEPNSGDSHDITIDEGEYAVNAICAGGNLSGYSQTQRRYSTVGNLRGTNGDANGAGTKSFSVTGASFNSALARLIPQS